MIDYSNQRCYKLDRNTQGRTRDLQPREDYNFFEKICLARESIHIPTPLTRGLPHTPLTDPRLLQPETSADANRQTDRGNHFHQ